MAGLKRSMVEFMLALVCLTVVPSVNGKPCAHFPAEDVIAGQSNLILSPILVVGACTSQSQCYPGRCVLGQCDCPEGYSDTGSSCSTNRELFNAPHTAHAASTIVSVSDGCTYTDRIYKARTDLIVTPVRTSHWTRCAVPPF